MTINLHIERLILDGVGVGRHQAEYVKAAVETELRRQLCRHGWGSTLQSQDNLSSVRSLVVEATPEPATLGRQIGKAVHEGIK